MTCKYLGIEEQDGINYYKLQNEDGRVGLFDDVYLKDVILNREMFIDDLSVYDNKIVIKQDSRDFIDREIAAYSKVLNMYKATGSSSFRIILISDGVYLLCMGTLRHILFIDDIVSQVDSQACRNALFHYVLEGNKEDFTLKVVGGKGLTTCKEMFNNYNFLIHLDLSAFDTSNVIDMSYMFERCDKLQDIKFINFNTENVTSMCGMFMYCHKLQKIDMGTFRTLKVSDMSKMFMECESLQEVNLSSFQVDNVEKCDSMFKFCQSLLKLDLCNFKFNKVRSFNSFLAYCDSLISVNMHGFKTKSAVSMSEMFSHCKSLEMIDLSAFDITNVATMERMFDNCDKLKILNLNSFNTINVMSLLYIFRSCKSLKELRTKDKRLQVAYQRYVLKIKSFGK